MELGLSGRSALISGASEGIGKAIAFGLAREGVNIALLARRLPALEEVAQEIRDECGVAVECVAADVTDSASVASGLEALSSKEPFRTLNILVNNAGVPATRPDRQLLWDDADWQEVIEVKALGALRIVRAALPMLATDGTGRIVNVTGATGAAVLKPGLVHGAANSALIQATGYLAADLAQDRINVNAIVPGLVGTEKRRKWVAGIAGSSGKPEDEVLAGLCKEIGIVSGRWAEVEEIADLVVFLASDRAKYINGAKIPIDGGLTLNMRGW